MPWSARPNRAELAAPIPIFRVAPGKALGGVILDDDLTGAYTHFYRGRTIMCTEHLCPACADGRAARWYGYCSIWSPTHGTTVILELTPACVPAINQFYDKHRTLRTAKITVSRANRKPNSRLICTIEPTQLDNAQLPQPPDIAAHLARMWELKPEPETTPQPGPLHHSQNRSFDEYNERNGTNY